MINSVETTSIIDGESFATFTRKANNNEHRTSGGSYESGEYFPVNIVLDGCHDSFVVPTELYEVQEDSCKFRGWMSIDGHRIYVYGQYDKKFENSFVAYSGEFD